MEVLKHGKTYKEIECKKCGALLSYNQKDVKVSKGMDNYFGEMHTWRKEYIHCPECSNVIMLINCIDGKDVLK